MKFKTLYGYEELPDTKQCSKCGEWKHFSAFGLRIGKLGSYSDTDPQNQGQRRNECDECKKRLGKQIKEARIHKDKTSKGIGAKPTIPDCIYITSSFFWQIVGQGQKKLGGDRNIKILPL